MDFSDNNIKPFVIIKPTAFSTNKKSASINFFQKKTLKDFFFFPSLIPLKVNSSEADDFLEEFLLDSVHKIQFNLSTKN